VRRYGWWILTLNPTAFMMTFLLRIVGCISELYTDDTNVYAKRSIFDQIFYIMHYLLFFWNMYAWMRIRRVLIQLGKENSDHIINEIVVSVNRTN